MELLFSLYTRSISEDFNAYSNFHGDLDLIKSIIANDCLKERIFIKLFQRTLSDSLHLIVFVTYLVLQI